MGVNGLAVNSKEVRVFPNPCNGLFTIQSNEVTVNLIIESYNALGVEIYTANLNPTSTLIDLGSNISGIFLYRVLTETGRLVSTGTFVIQK